MGKRIDVAEVGCTAEARALLDRLDDSEVISLGVLSGADLCVLGATGHPVCWEALRGAWRRLDEKEREQLAETSALGMLRRDLVQGPAAWPRGLRRCSCRPRTSRAPSLGILLGARQSPALIIATHHESRTPAITYFQPQGVSAIVEEIPERVDSGMPGTPRSPLNGHLRLPTAHAGLRRRGAGSMGDEADSGGALSAEAAAADLLLRLRGRRQP